ncbi:MAG: hypothetical protein ABI273_12255 [Lacunisphaera sp.]
MKSSHTREIITFLHHCKKTHSPVTVALIKQWLASHETAQDGPAHVALRWFYRSAPKAADTDSPPSTMATNVSQDKPAPTGNGLENPAGGEPIFRSSRSTSETKSYAQRPPWRPMEPRPASQDLGGPDWEQALVATLRLRGLLSRTEDTYRSWAAYRLRHAAFAFGGR